MYALSGVLVEEFNICNNLIDSFELYIFLLIKKNIVYVHRRPVSIEFFVSSSRHIFLPIVCDI